MNNIDVEIKNFGKIKNAKFQVKPFTLIAGKNASGKSYLTRSLYSIFSSLNKDHLSIDIDSELFLMNHYLRVLHLFVDNPSFVVSQKIGEIQFCFKTLNEKIDLIYHRETLISQIGQKDDLLNDIKKIQIECKDFLLQIKTIKKYRNIIVYIKNITDGMDRLFKLVEVPHESLAKGLSKQLDKSLRNNFLVNSLDKLKNRAAGSDEEISFNFGKTIGRIDIKPKNNFILFDLNPIGIDEFQQIDNVVYLESPVYWKFRDVLEGWAKSRQDPSLRRRIKRQQNELTKIPDYILDTFALLNSDIINDSSDNKLHGIKQKITATIGGQVQISDSGDIHFLEVNETNNEMQVIDLHHAATGAVSLGIIALLIDKNVIVPNSILIFDEPEVNLHPAWQQVMVSALYALSVAGVRVIMASHSFDMVENIEKLMDKHPDSEIEDHFSIIQLEDGKTVNEEKPIFKKLDAVKADLGMPLFNLFLD
ncbi:MAG: putative ATPase [Polaribacter sp.]|jgi:predicted ATPase